MTVRTLIEKLKKHDKDAVVRLHRPDGEVVIFTCALANDNNLVWLETESDGDMGEELSERFEQAELNGTGEIDFYKGLLELGIDVSMVRRYMGDVPASHMKKILRWTWTIMEKE